MKGPPGGDAAVQRRRGRAGEAAPEPGRDQHLGRVAGRSCGIGQIGGVVEDKAQRDAVALGPFEGRAEGRQLPGGDIGQVALPGAQRIFGGAATVEIGQRFKLGGGQMGGKGQG